MQINFGRNCFGTRLDSGIQDAEVTWSGAGSVRDSQECFLVTNDNAGIVANWPMRALENLPEQRPSHKCSEVMNNESGATLEAAPWPDLQWSSYVIHDTVRRKALIGQN